MGDFSDVVLEIRERMVKVEVLQEGNTQAITQLVATVNRLIEKLDDSKDVARSASERVSEAHLRINKLEESRTWMWKTMFGGFIVGAFTFFFGWIGK